MSGENEKHECSCHKDMRDWVITIECLVQHRAVEIPKGFPLTTQIRRAIDTIMGDYKQKGYDIYDFNVNISEMETEIEFNGDM